MNLWLTFGFVMTLTAGRGEDVMGLVVEPNNHVELVDSNVADTELLLAFAIFRHGDRTPDEEELALYPSAEKKTVDTNIFFPYGMKALTNKGKQRGYLVGQYLRQRYDGFLSRFYLPDEIKVRTTDYARTKMTALTALSALYPPVAAQRWNPALDWQPVPYDTLPGDLDDMLYYYNCPRYIWLRNKVYELPEMKKVTQMYHKLFDYISEMTSTNITTPEGVFYIDNLFQTLENVGLRPPKWAVDVMPQIKDMTKIEYHAEFYNDELIQLASGVLISDILNATSAYLAGYTEQPKVRLYSAHENNVAALMAASRVFKPHQPQYGATFSLELRRHNTTGQYGVTAVYSPNAGGPGAILPISGCGDRMFCDYDTFSALVQDTALSRQQFRSECKKSP